MHGAIIISNCITATGFAIDALKAAGIELYQVWTDLEDVDFEAYLHGFVTKDEVPDLWLIHPHGFGFYQSAQEQTLGLIRALVPDSQPLTVIDFGSSEPDMLHGIPSQALKERNIRLTFVQHDRSHEWTQALQPATTS